MCPIMKNKAPTSNKSVVGNIRHKSPISPNINPLQMYASVSSEKVLITIIRMTGMGLRHIR